MVVTLTLNPAVDRTATVARLTVGGTNRVQSTRQEGGGKGINVSRALAAMGEPSTAMGLFGGAPGRQVLDELPEGVQSEPNWLRQGDTRTNVKIVAEDTNQTTEFNEAGPWVSTEELESLEARIVGKLSQGDYLVLAGSLPPGVPETFYQRLTTAAKERGVRCVLDTSGPSLAAGLRARPDVVKPNQAEAALTLGRPLHTREAQRQAVRELLQQGPRLVVLSLGGDGAVFGRGRELLWTGLSVETVRNTVGCGDTMVAAVVYGLQRGWELLRIGRFAAAAAGGTASLEGTAFPSLETIEKLEPLVESEVWS